jgi:hypothetical protein
MQRFEPSKRRRNTSSVSSPVGTRDMKADTEDDNHRASPTRDIEARKNAAEVGSDS